ncbi:hypothetical protein LTR66_012338, partial [Elasticomyces elasticus]
MAYDPNSSYQPPPRPYYSQRPSDQTQPSRYIEREQLSVHRQAAQNYEDNYNGGNAAPVGNYHGHGKSRAHDQQQYNGYQNEQRHHQQHGYDDREYRHTEYAEQQYQQQAYVQAQPKPQSYTRSQQQWHGQHDAQRQNIATTQQQADRPQQESFQQPVQWQDSMRVEDAARYQDPIGGAGHRKQYVRQPGTGGPTLQKAVQGQQAIAQDGQGRPSSDSRSVDAALPQPVGSAMSQYSTPSQQHHERLVNGQDTRQRPVPEKGASQTSIRDQSYAPGAAPPRLQQPEQALPMRQASPTRSAQALQVPSSRKHETSKPVRIPLIEPDSPELMPQDNAFPIFPSKKKANGNSSKLDVSGDERSVRSTRSSNERARPQIVSTRTSESVNSGSGGSNQYASRSIPPTEPATQRPGRELMHLDSSRPSIERRPTAEEDNGNSSINGYGHVHEQRPPRKPNSESTGLPLAHNVRPLPNQRPTAHNDMINNSQGYPQQTVRHDMGPQRSRQAPNLAHSFSPQHQYDPSDKRFAQQEQIYCADYVYDSGHAESTQVIPQPRAELNHQPNPPPMQPRYVTDQMFDQNPPPQIRPPPAHERAPHPDMQHRGSNVQPIQTQQRGPPTQQGFDGPLSPAYVPPRPSTSQNSRPPQPYGNEFQSTPTYEQVPVSKPWVNQRTKHGSLGDVYGDHYQDDLQPRGQGTYSSREAEIEAEMPNFNDGERQRSAQRQGAAVTPQYYINQPQLPPGTGPDFYQQQGNQTFFQPDLTVRKQHNGGISDGFMFDLPQELAQPQHSSPPNPQPLQQPSYRQPPQHVQRPQPITTGSNPLPRGYSDEQHNQQAMRPIPPEQPYSPSHQHFHRPGPHHDRSNLNAEAQPQGQRLDSALNARAPSAPPLQQRRHQLPVIPADGAPLAQQRSAPADQRPRNPDALPHHPVPIRPGLMEQSPPPQPAKPPPVRNYSGTNNDRRPSITNSSIDASRGSAVVTHAELDRLRRMVSANPQDNATSLTLAKKLVEAASVLASENGTLDARATAKNREKYILDAHKRVKKLVNAAYPEAQFYLADCYGQGLLGLEVDTKEAFTLYQAAAKWGHAPAAYRTAVCCEMGPEE